MTAPSRQFMIRKACYQAMNRELKHAPDYPLRNAPELFRVRMDNWLVQPFSEIEKHCGLMPLIREEFSKIAASCAND